MPPELALTGTTIGRGVIRDKVPAAIIVQHVDHAVAPDHGDIGNGVTGGIEPADRERAQRLRSDGERQAGRALEAPGHGFLQQQFDCVRPQPNQVERAVAVHVDQLHLRDRIDRFGQPADIVSKPTLPGQNRSQDAACGGSGWEWHG